jgi:hypothetical protein
VLRSGQQGAPKSLLGIYQAYFGFIVFHFCNGPLQFCCEGRRFSASAGGSKPRTTRNFADEMKQYLLPLVEYTPRAFKIHSFVSM